MKDDLAASLSTSRLREICPELDPNQKAHTRHNYVHVEGSLQRTDI